MTLTHADAAALFARARDKGKGKKIDHDTYLRSVDDGFVIRFHNTDVVTILKKNQYVLRANGWLTNNTRERIEENSPARIRSDGGVWYVGDALFQDGIRVDATGKPVGKYVKADVAAAKKEALDKAIDVFVQGFMKEVEDGEVEDPGPGDCWGCLLFVNSDENSLKRVDHLLSHMEEDYFVPSLLLNAIREGVAGISWQSKSQQTDVERAVAYQWHGVQRRQTKDAKRYLRRYFFRRKAALLDIFNAKKFAKTRREHEASCDEG